MTYLTKNWLILIALSAVSTAIAASGATGAALTLAVLILAGLKARVILSAYLGLNAVPGWQRGFDLGLTLLLALMAALALAA